VWVSTPGGRPYDTSYSNPIITTIDGVRLLLNGLGDGSMVAVKPQTGEPVWRFEMAKRGINTAAVMAGKYAIVSHGDENLDVNVMGMIAAVDATGHGALGKDAIKWAEKGFEAGYSSPILDGDRVYQIDNAANLHAFDVETGRSLWKQNIGTIQKASPILADGKLYVGTESGRFLILRPHADRVEILSAVELPPSKEGTYSAGTPEPVLSGAAVAHGRVYFASIDTLYCIGRKSAAKDQPMKLEPLPKGEGPVAYVLVRPTEVMLKPREAVQLKAVTFDARGRELGEEKAAWSLDGLKGTVADGKFTAEGANIGQAGSVKATVGTVSGAARIRVAQTLPWSIDFESAAVASAPPPQWISATTGKFQVQELDGHKVLAKMPDETIFRRMRVFCGPDDLANYTVEADVRVPERRRQMGDAGVLAQRYALVLFGNNQKLELFPWQPETTRTVSVPFEWQKDTWYHLKLRVDNVRDGTRVRGKAWKTGDTEPEAWNIDKVDPVGNREGSPGLFGDAQFGLYFDNVKVTANQ
jgi:hypothetical protein